jgi:hypothetical protein
MSVNRINRFENLLDIQINGSHNGNTNVAPKELPKLEGFRGFVEAMVEDVIIEDKPFDSYKDELKKQCEIEGVEYNDLECDLEDFLENLNMGIKSPDGLAIAMAMAFALEDAKKCYVREEKIEEIVGIWNKRYPNQEYHPHNPIP